VRPVRLRQLVFLGSLWAGSSVLSILVIALLWTGWIQPQALAEIRAQRGEVVRILAGITEIHVKDKLDGLASIAGQLGGEWPRLARLPLQRELDGYRDVLQLPTLFVASPDGRPLAFSPLRAPDGSSNLERNYADRGYFREAVRTQSLVISGVIYGRAAQELVVAAALPVRSRGKTVAYLIGAISLRSSAQAIEQAAGRTSGWFALVDRDRRAVHIDPELRQLVVQDWSGHPALSVLGPGEAAGFVDIDEVHSLVTQAPIPSLRVNLAFIGRVRTLLAGQQRLLRVVLLGVLVSVAVSLAVSTVIGFRFLREHRRPPAPPPPPAAEQERSEELSRV
jgi:hypothetical protein